MLLASGRKGHSWRVDRRAPGVWAALVLLGCVVACDAPRAPGGGGGGGGGNRGRDGGSSSTSSCAATAPIRCTGTRLERCNAGAWQLVMDCGANRTQCVSTSSQSDASCSSAHSCSTGMSGGKCMNGSACASPGDCASNTCGPSGTCVSGNCLDNQKSGDETGIDCGGSCPACFGESCSADTNCVTRYCFRGRCAEPSCTDGAKNGDETAIDCGGSCSPCGAGMGCTAGHDCQSGLCVSGRCNTPAASCSDNAKNGAETDVDCGGTCGGCALAKTCAQDADCLSAFCNFGRCDRATCSDQIQNQGESDVDCGGSSCPACADRDACLMSSDCSSRRCEGQQCASCRDGVQTGGELGIDCGGPCSPCADGTPCSSGSQCGGGTCSNGRCCTPNRCGFCGPLPQEVCNGVDDDCDGMVDNARSIGPPPLCHLQAGVCAGSTAECRGSGGWVCDAAVYTAHAATYAANDLPCDLIDNDCNGQVDETPCPDTGNPCTTSGCGLRNACVTSNRPVGTPCPTGAPAGLEPLYYCATGGTCRETRLCSESLMYDGGTNPPSLLPLSEHYLTNSGGRLNSRLLFDRNGGGNGQFCQCTTDRTRLDFDAAAAHTYVNCAGSCVTTSDNMTYRRFICFP